MNERFPCLNEGKTNSSANAENRESDRKAWWMVAVPYFCRLFVLLKGKVRMMSAEESVCSSYAGETKHLGLACYCMDGSCKYRHLVYQYSVCEKHLWLGMEVLVVWTSVNSIEKVENHTDFPSLSSGGCVVVLLVSKLSSSDPAGSRLRSITPLVLLPPHQSPYRSKPLRTRATRPPWDRPFQI